MIGKKYNTYVTQYDLHIMFIKEVTWGSWTHQHVWMMKNANTDISLCTYAYTSNFQEYVLYNKYENVNIMSY
jgi:hypothetical protein